MTATLEAQKHTSDGQIEIPPEVCNFRLERAVKFAAVETDGKGDRMSIRILANSGEPILGHYWWGNFAIDLEGLQIGRQDKPILLDHRSDQIVGYTSKIELTDDGVIAEGTVLAGDSDCFEYGRRVKEFADEGYPWQSSVYVPPLEVEYIPRDTFVMVNGHKLEGPGHVFRKAVLREVTVTSLGADENTDAEMFGEKRKELIVGKLTKKEPDVAEPKAAEATETGNAPEKLSEKAPAKSKDAADPQPQPAPEAKQLSEVEVERNRVARLTAAAEPHQHALLSQIVKDGVELADGLEQLFADHKKFKSDRLQSLVETCAEDLGMDADDNDDAPKLGDTPEGRARAKFRADKDLQEEFCGDEELYISFRQTEGLKIEERN